MFNYFFYYHIYEKETNLNFVHFANTKPTLSLTSRQNITSHAYTTRFRTLQLTNNTFSIPQKFKHFLLPLFETMLIKLNSLNINGFNKSADKLAQFINQHNIHITFIQETHTIQQQQLSHFAHQYNFLVYPNTDHFLTPQISHRQETLTIINSNHLHLKPQMISSNIILPTIFNYSPLPYLT